jgi:hypothetical protein
VACDAADTGRDVHAVREIGVIGKLVDADPAHRPSAGEAVPNRSELRAVLFRGLVAVHAGLGRRDVRDVGNFNRRVTVPAIQTEFADVQLVAVRNRLYRLIADVRVPRRKVVPDTRYHQHRTEDARNGRHDRKVVPPTGEYLSQCD